MNNNPPPERDRLQKPSLGALSSDGLFWDHAGPAAAACGRRKYTLEQCTKGIYFETKIVFLGEGNICRIGFCHAGFPSKNYLPGGLLNSFSYCSDGKMYSWGHDKGKGSSCGRAFTSKDTIGCGLTSDSFHQLKFFVTLNGEFLCFSPFNVHAGMDPVAVVGVDGSAKVRVNFGQSRFLWDISRISTFVNFSVEYSMPNDVLELVLSYSAETPFQVMYQLGLVAKQWNKMVRSDGVWRKLFLMEWPHQNPKLKVKWLSHYKTRYTSLKLLAPAQVHPIENCDFEFLCPFAVEVLQQVSKDMYYCTKCKKRVAKVYNQTQLEEQIRIGNCITYEQHPLVPDTSIRGMGAIQLIRKCKTQQNAQLIAQNLKKINQT
eukprot:TRINITY_DN5639_c0_g1_i2.p1 TRINITY_DN5639_c0_g1~~TRINITY_DN5639_c0_g1_i2.p1  ORF type:complete len:374 (+),score=70.22 TRINITY_DN5639_c0_g1_i2:648-1769(+)